MRGEQSSPIKFVELGATNDADAIKFGRAKIAEEKPELYDLSQARVCRGEEVIWSVPERQSTTDFAHASVLAALQGVADGKQIDQHVTTPSFGKPMRIFDALNGGIKLDGVFHADHLDVVDRAFTKIGRERPSNKIGEVARAILTALVPKR
jgi:hypothetical protein